MADRKNLHWQTTHFVSMQPAMLKTFPVHNGPLTAITNDLPPGINLT